MLVKNIKPPILSHSSKLDFPFQTKSSVETSIGDEVQEKPC